MDKVWRVIKIALACVLFAVLSASAKEAARAASSATSAPMIVSYNKIPSFSNAYLYRYELIQQILDITRPEFGDYELKNYEMDITSMRQAQFLSEGNMLNVAWGSPGTVIAEADAIPIEIDFLNGLLCYRVCLINKNNPIDASKFSDAASLSQLRIGQGLWADIDIYKFNQLTPKTAPSFDSLFSILGSKRIDCIALGINEVESIYQDKKDRFPILDIDDKLLIHYYFPTYFYVSKSHPELAKRFELGLKKLKKNGDFDKLLLKYHGKYLANLDLPNRKMICLNSPFETAKDSCTLPTDLLKKITPQTKSQ